MMPLRKKIMIAFAILIGLLVAVYFTVSSTAFVKKFVLPRVGQSMHAAVTIGDASISPFSSVEIKQLKVVPDGEEPLIDVEEVRLRYSLLGFLSGRVEVSELTLSGATVNLVQKPDGTSNLDPLLKGSTTPSTSSSGGSKSSINIRNVAIRNATVRQVKILASGRREVSEVSGVNVTLDQLANGQPGKLAVTADLKNESVAPAGLIQAKADGKYEFTLDPALGPKNVKGQLRLDITKAEGAYNPFGSLAAILDCDLNTTDVRDLSLRFEQAGRALGRITVSGPFTAATKEGRLKVQIPGIDRQVLNLVGAASGIDFATTVISSTNTVDIMAKGSQINAVGQLQASQFSLKKNGQTSTPSDLKLGYAIIINQREGSTLLRNLTVTGTRNQTTWLQGSLTKPMTVVPGKTPATVTANDSAFDLTVAALDLADWKGFLGSSVSAGKLGLTLNAASVNGGKQIKVNLTSAVTDLSVTVKDNPLTQARLDFASQLQVDDLKKLTVNSYKVNLTQQGKLAARAEGNALFDSSAGSVYLLANIDAIASQLFGSGPSTVLTSGVRFDGIMKDQHLTLKDLEVTLNPTERAPKNELHLSGKFDLSNPNFTKGGVDLKADALDVTQLYDLFTAKSPAAAKAVAASPTASSGNVEPDPVFLPLKEFTANLTVNRLFLHEIAISNWTAKTSIDGGKIKITPFQLTLNGAPVNASADLNLEVKGFSYDVGLTMDKVPLEPIANTFVPEHRGQYQGNILSDIKVKGTGTTGASLKNSLGGQIGLTFTNANIQIVSEKSKSLMTPIANMLRVPDLLSTPLNWINTRIDLGNGKISLTDIFLESPAFQAQIRGEIPIADVLNNSPLREIPADFYLSSYLARKSNLMPAGAAQNAAYVKMPNFVKLAGTMQTPSVELDRTVLATLTLKSLSGIQGVAGTDAGKAIQSVGNLLSGQKSSGTNKVAGTNAPATNASPSVLDLFKKKK